MQAANLQAVADLKADQIRNWRQQLLNNGHLIFFNRIMTDQLLSFLRRPASPEKKMFWEWLENSSSHLRYLDIILSDAKGNVRLSARGGETRIGSDELRFSDEARRKREVTISDLHRSDFIPQIHLETFVPLVAGEPKGSASVDGFLILISDPQIDLYPLIQSWPTPSPSAETLLVRREGDDVLYLNELRHRKNTALKLRIPLRRTEIPAVRAALGKTGEVSGQDYRGVAVWSVLKPVPDSNWIIVAKVDREEIERPIRRSALAIFLVALSLVLAAAMLILLLWQRQNSIFRLRQLEAKNQNRALVQHFDYLTRFANDIILLCDEKGNILEANERALLTYGFNQEKLLKLNIQDLRVPEERNKLAEQIKTAESPLGMLFETLHQRKDGSTFPVEVSARVIAVDDKKYFQSIIRDISERKEAEAKLLHANRLYAVLSQVNQAIVCARDREKLFQDICDVAVEFGKFRMAWIGLVDDKSRIVKPAFQAGHAAGYLDHIAISIDDRAAGRGPTGTAVRENRVVVCNDIRSDEKMDPWREEAVKCGYLSSAALPLRFQGKAIGALSLYSSEISFFDTDVQGLLAEITGDIGFALDALDHEARRRQVESQREAALEALRESEDKFKYVFDNSVIGKSITLPGGEISVNKAFCAMLGYSAEEMKSRKWQELTPPDDMEITQKALDAVLSGEKDSVRFEKRYIHKNGSIVWADVGTALRRDAAGKPLYFMTAVIDITENKRAEQALHDSEEKYRGLFDNAEVGMYRSRLDGSGIVALNQCLADIFGFSIEEMLSSPATMRWADPKAREEMVRLLHERGELRNHELGIVTKSGEVRTVLASMKLYPGEDYLEGTAVDITKIKRAEEALRVSERKFRETVTNLDEGYYSVTLDGILLEHNQAFNRMLGFEIHKDLKGVQLPDFWQDPEERRDYLRAFAVTGSISNYQINAKTQTGEKITVLASAHLVKDQNDRPQRIEGIFLDITKRIRAEMEIKQLNEELEQRVQQRTSQLEATNKELEAFSYSVSHDLRAPLRAIEGFSRIVLEEYAPRLDDEGRRLLNVVAANTRKMGQLIDDLLAFSRLSRQQMAFSAVDLAALADDVFSELKSTEKGRRIEFKTGALPAAFGDSSMLRHVLQNLLSNAVKFTRTKSRARIEFGGQAAIGESIYYVKDNGVGFDMEYVHKLFGVFQRLHSSDEFEGTGVGLAIVQRIVLRHGGRVWATSTTKDGATFYFALPTGPVPEAETLPAKKAAE